VGEIRQKGNQSLSWCGAEEGLSDMRGIEVLALRLRGIEPRRSRVVAAEGNIGSSCREDTSGWRVESDACRLRTEEERASNLAIQRIGYPRHASCVRTWRAAGTDPLIADVRRGL
jgi:hypothetical protein